EIKMNYIDKVLSLEEETVKVSRDVGKKGERRTKEFTGERAKNIKKAALKRGFRDDDWGRPSKHIIVPDRGTGAFNTTVSTEHAVYKQMGIVLAEALGHRVDEIAPVLAGAARGLAMAAKAGGRMAGQAAKAGVQKAGQAGKAGAQKAGQAGKEMAKDAAIKAGKEKLQNKLAGPEEEPEDG
ncbi:MAG: hypothetical protein ACYSSM_05085, partial [Planctomycetota bacterium]